MDKKRKKWQEWDEPAREPARLRSGRFGAFRLTRSSGCGYKGRDPCCGDQPMTAPESFQDLMSRVRAGDEAAAVELVRRYEPAIRRTIRARLLDDRLCRAFDSMDVCQS